MNPLKSLKKWMRLPNPVELGRASYNALPIRDLPGPNEDAYTWEDWKEEVTEKYPVRFWLTYTFVRSVINPVRRKVKAAWYWLTCHVLPSRRFHLLDLRSPGPGITYSYGWMDMAEVIQYACFVALRKFVEGEQPVDPTSWATPEQFADPTSGLAEQKAKHDEVMALYEWWMRGRLQEEHEEGRLFQETRRFDRRSVEYRAAVDAWLGYREWLDTRADEMLHRVISVRRYLWT